MKVLFLLHDKDRSYASFIKSHAPGFITSGKVLFNESISYLSEIDTLCEVNKCQAVVTTDYKILKILFPDKQFRDPDSEGYAKGLSVLNFQGNTLYTKKGIKILIVAPLRHLVTVKEAPFLFRHFLEKLGDASTKRFIPLPPINIKYISTQKDAEVAIEELSTEPVCAFDIETSSHRRITHISFSSIKATYSFTINDLLDVHNIRKILMNDSLKIAQNGKYDCLHLLHWGCPIRNYYFDTYGLMQCLYAELPRSLDFIGSFFLDDMLYWKDEADKDKALYNAKDTHVTLWSFLSFMRTAPQWAIDNYVSKFKITFPHLSSEFEGIATDIEILERLRLSERKKIEESLDKINAMLGTKTFNPNSPPQVKSLLQVLSPKAKIEGTSKAQIAKSAARHPLNAHVLAPISKYRESLKLHSTYIDAKLWHKRVIYSLNAFGTETGRSSCTASSFADMVVTPKGKHDWQSFGIQLQNVPEEFKICLVADPDFLLVEMDKEQAESRCTAYLAQEERMIEAVEKSPDFHSSNASAFFGIPFDELWDTLIKKTKNKPIRDLAKRVNHGANYNMGVFVLIQTMGEENLWKAKALLKLNPSWGLEEIAGYLLAVFDQTYPRLRNKVTGWYGELIQEWRTHDGKIKTPDGWTRKFFGDPTKNKMALNELVAHSPQHLNVALVDEGYFKIWYELEHPERFRVKGQIHDSVFFQVHKDHIHLVDRAKEIYDETARITVHGREMFIPSAITGPKTHWK